MSQKMHEYLTDPVTGRTLTRQERWAKLGQRFADQTPSTLPMPTGTFAERQKQRHETSLLQREIAAQIAAEAAASKPKGNPFASRIADLAAQLEWAIPTEQGGIERRLSAMRKAAAEWEATREAAERRATYETSSAYRRLKEHYEAFMAAREVAHPDLSDSDVMLLRAIATSDAFPSPGEQASAYFAQVTKCESLQAQREAERLQIAEQAATLAVTAYGEQRARVDDANKRLEAASEQK